MRYVKATYVTLIVALGFCTQATASDLFADSTLRDIKVKTKLSPDDTQGGYAIYPGDGRWEFYAGSVGGTTGPDAIFLGRSSWVQYEGSTLFAQLDLTANLNQGAASSSWSGNPCGGTHLVTVNKQRGREDHCMVVDTESKKIGTAESTFLKIRITHSAAAGRYYVMTLSINPQLLGHMDTVPVEWTPAQLEQRPDRKEFLAAFGRWGETLLDASGKAFGFDKPQDAYKDVTSFRTLMPISESVSQKTSSLSFASAMLDLKYKKDFRAMALSVGGDGRNRWHRAWGYETQAEADKRALDGCNKEKSTSLPACELITLTP